jgi:hypothetical protein
MPFSSPPSSLRTVLKPSSHLRPGLPTSLFSSCLSTQILFVIAVVLTGTAFPPYLILLDLLVLITFDSQYKLSSSTLCTFLFPHFIFHQLKTSCYEGTSFCFQITRFKPYTNRVTVTSSNTLDMSPVMVNFKFC